MQNYPISHANITYYETKFELRTILNWPFERKCIGYGFALKDGEQVCLKVLRAGRLRTSMSSPSCISRFRVLVIRLLVFITDHFSTRTRTRWSSKTIRVETRDSTIQDGDDRFPAKDEIKRNHVVINRRYDSCALAPIYIIQKTYIFQAKSVVEVSRLETPDGA